MTGQERGGKAPVVGRVSGRGGHAASLPAPRSPPCTAPESGAGPPRSPLPAPADFQGSASVLGAEMGDARGLPAQTLGVDPRLPPAPPVSARLSPSSGPGGKGAPQVCPCLDQSLPTLAPSPGSPPLPLTAEGCLLWAGGRPRLSSAGCLGSHVTNCCPGVNAPAQECAERRQGCQDILVGSQVGP